MKLTFAEKQTSQELCDIQQGIHKLQPKLRELHESRTYGEWDAYNAILLDTLRRSK